MRLELTLEDGVWRKTLVVEVEFETDLSAMIRDRFKKDRAAGRTGP